MEHVRNLAGLRNPSKRTHVASHVLGSGDLGWNSRSGPCLAAAAGPFESQRVLVRVVQP